MNADLSTGTMVVSIVAMLGWLVLNMRAMQSHQLGMEKTLKYAAAWVAIFAFVAFLASRFGG
jgi:hypothetical protein